MSSTKDTKYWYSRIYLSATINDDTYEVRFTQNGSDGWARTQFLNLKNANKQRTTRTTIIR